MTISKRCCPECGEEILFSYVVPSKTYRIEDGKIKRDDAWEGIMYDNPSISFFCSNDKEHNIETPTIVYEQDFYEWAEEIEDEFYSRTIHT